ncbi:MAG: DUF2937 family protein [Rhodospirillaceae bacterium]|nr:MAG: DUF2937 family protein [Rhodospirillaceae bacterium]
MVSWFWQKLDLFLAATVIALAGVAASQGHEVIVQYIQQLDARVDQARDHLTDVQTGLRYRVMGDTVRAELEAEAQGIFNTLKQKQDAVVGANALTRPVALARHRDKAILANTWHGFRPALPTTAGAALYAVIGMILGFIAYEAIKVPIMFIVREPRRRKFRRRG